MLRQTSLLLLFFTAAAKHTIVVISSSGSQTSPLGCSAARAVLAIPSPSRDLYLLADKPQMPCRDLENQLHMLPATMDTLLSTLNDIGTKCAARRGCDVALLHVGHGGPVAWQQGVPSEWALGWETLDSNLRDQLDSAQWHQAIKQLAKSARHTTLLLNACYSGGIGTVLDKDRELMASAHVMTVGAASDNSTTVGYSGGEFLEALH